MNTTLPFPTLLPAECFAPVPVGTAVSAPMGALRRVLALFPCAEEGRVDRLSCAYLTLSPGRWTVWATDGKIAVVEGGEAVGILSGTIAFPPAAIPALRLFTKGKKPGEVFIDVKTPRLADVGGQPMATGDFAGQFIDRVFGGIHAVIRAVEPSPAALGIDLRYLATLAGVWRGESSSPVVQAWNGRACVFRPLTRTATDRVAIVMSITLPE